MDQHREQVEHQELLFGILASKVVNFSMGAPKHPTVPADFMPSRMGRSTQAKTTRTNRKRVAEDVRAFFEKAIKIQNARRV